MHIEDVEAFTTWLVRELRPICDAEPPVLAKYVLSLIRKPDKTDDEIREFCTTQLEVFLQSNTKRFVEKMFAALKDASYMEQKAPAAKKENTPAAAEKRAETEPKPTTSRDPKAEVKKHEPAARKEEVVKKEEPRTARRRISPPPSEAKKELAAQRDRDNRRRSRSPQQRARRGDRRRSPERRQRRSRSRSTERRKTGEERKKRRCRDYDEQGVCTRGDQCPYDHGPDPVVFDRDSMSLPPNLSVPPPGYNPLNPPPPGVESIYTAPPNNSSTAVEGYNPEAPALTSANYSVPPPPLPLQMSQAPWRPTSYSINTVHSVPVYDPSSGVPVDPTTAPSSGHHGPMRGGMRGRGRGGGRGAHHAGPPHFNPNRGAGDGKTLQVSRVPQEQNNITKLNEHFAQFGNIVNIQVRFEGDPECALITYTCKAEATAAVKSPAPVLNNRFIRVNFYRPPETEPANGSASADVSLSSGVRVSKPPHMAVEKPKVASVGESKFVNTAFTVKEKAKAKKKELSAKAKSLLEAHKKQLMLLDSLIKQQKTIFGKLRDENTDAEAKKRLKELAKTTSDQIGVAKTLSASLGRQLEENTAALKEVQVTIDELLKKSPGEGDDETISVTGGRKRAATDAEGSPAKKKCAGVALLVTGFTLADEQKVTEAMETAGELLDVEIQPGGGPEVSAVYIYKSAVDADKIMSSPPSINGSALAISKTTNKLDSQPATPGEDSPVRTATAADNE